jgi:hypothetical protein
MSCEHAKVRYDEVGPYCTDCGAMLHSHSAKSTQIGGSHYRDMVIQPVEYVLANGLGFVEGCVVKYVSRWKSKGGVEDLRKARHFLDLLIEHETRDEA